MTLCSQQAHCKWIEDRIESMTLPLMKPINDLNDDIQATLDGLEEKQEELEKQKIYLSRKLKSAPEECLTKNLLLHANVHSSWDLEGCLNLTGDWRDGILFGMKFAIESINITTQIWTTVNTAMNCSEVGIFHVVQCYYNTVTSLKDQIFYLKEKVAPLIAEGNKILLNMKKDFKYCLGIPQTLQYRIEKNLGNCIKNGPQKLSDYPQTLLAEEMF